MTIEEQIQLYDQIAQSHFARNEPVLTQMKTIMNEVFGESYNQIQIVDNRDHIAYHTTPDLNTCNESTINQYMHAYGLYRLVVYFPEITITNTRDASHNIKDLFVGFTLNTEARMLKMFGRRSSFTRREFLSNYAHSHLSGASHNYWGNFCLGHGPIGQAMTLLGHEDFDPIEFRLLCYHLKMYVKHESIEGVPYYNMEDISTSAALRSINDTSLSERTHHFGLFYRTLFQEVDSEEILKSLKYTIKENSVKIDPTPELEIILGEVIDTVFNRGDINTDYRPYYQCTRSANGTYFSTNEDISAADLNREIVVINFKGTDFKLNIVQEDGIQNMKIYAHPAVTEFICKKLSENFTKTGYKFSKV